jgi:hypothetical protein
MANARTTIDFASVLDGAGNADALDRLKLRALERKLGRKDLLELLGAGQDALLAMAEEAEQTANTCGPFDPAFARFSQEKTMLLDLAVLHERLVPVDA